MTPRRAGALLSALIALSAAAADPKSADPIAADADVAKFFEERLAGATPASLK